MNSPRLLKQIAVLGLFFCIGCLCIIFSGSNHKPRIETNQSRTVVLSPHSPPSPSVLAKNLKAAQVNPLSYYWNEPAPMGIADFGIDPSTNHSYSYNSSSFLGTIAINSLVATGQSFIHDVSIQLNLVLKFKVGSVVYAYWLQNCAFFDTSINYIWFEGCIVNFSTPYPNPSTLDISTMAGNGEIYPAGGVDYYIVPPPPGTPGQNVSITYPRTIYLQTNSSIDGMGQPTVTFSFNDGYGWQIIDQVTFYIGPGAFTDWNMVVDGFQYAPVGYLFYDAELVLGGYGDGDIATAVNVDTNFSLDYFNGHNMEGIPCAYNFGSNTYERFLNIVSQPMHDNASGHHFTRLQAGNGPLSSAWNSSTSAIGNFILSNLDGGTLIVGTATYSFSGIKAQVAICPGTYPVYLNGVFITNYTFLAGLNTIVIADYKLLSARSAPKNMIATVGNACIYLAWTAPAMSDCPGITNYNIYIGTKSGDERLRATIGNVTAYTATGLTNGRMYYFEVSAVNGTGEGFPSNETIATPMTVPTRPSALYTMGENGKIFLQWVDPASDGGSPITNYMIYMGMTLGGETLLVTVGHVWSYECTGLMKGPIYYFKVAAVNSMGTGANSTERFAKAQTYPQPPTNLILTAGNGQINLSWNAPADDGGSPIVNYTIYQGPEWSYEIFLVTVGNVTTFTSTSLTNGKIYYFRITAVNGIGEGSFSNEPHATPMGPPSAPRSLTAAGGDTNVTLTWDAPANHGLTPIEGYVIYSGTASNAETFLVTVGNVTTFLVTGLMNGQVYYFTVASVNSEGSGPNATELAIMPGGYPSAPRSLNATASNAQIVLNWLAPASDGGNAITGYDIYRGTSSNAEILVTSLGITLTYTATNLTNGQVYFYKVAAVNSHGMGPNATEASATPATVPDAPTGLTLTPGNTQVILNWVAPVWNGGSAITGYQVYRGMTSGGETLIAYLGLVLTYTSTGLPNGQTFYFVVSASNRMGYSNVSMESSAMPANVPSAPTLTTATPGNAQVVLVWRAPGSDGGAAITGYKVYIGTTSCNEVLNTTLGVVLTYNATGLTIGQIYYFQVSALNIMGESARSYEKAAIPVTVPGAPTITSTWAGNAQVDLWWSAPSNDGGLAITHYCVYQGTTSGVESLLVILGVVLSFSSTGLTNGVTYYYKVAAVNGIGTGANSTEASATPATLTIPSAPQLLTATPGNAQVTLTWTKPASNGGLAILNYLLYRGTAPNGELLLYSVGNVTIVYNTGLVNGVTYYYKVAAVNGVGIGANSTEVSATPTNPITIPSAPQLLAATPGNAQVSLTWTSPANNGGSAITNYRIYRGMTSGGEVLLLTIGNVTMYGNTGLTNGVTYYYTVAAVNGMGTGANSTEVNGTPTNIIATPSAPQFLTATPGNALVMLTWTCPANNGGSAITNYGIFRGTISGGEVFHLFTGNVTSFYELGLTNGVTYYYKVAAWNSMGLGVNSTEISATPTSIITTPSAPQSLIATPGNTQVTLTWTTPTNNGGSAITNFRIYYGTISGGESLLLTIGNVTMYNSTGLTNGVKYYYKVAAVNGMGTGSNSTEVSAIPSSGISGVPALSPILPNPNLVGNITLTWTTVAGAQRYYLYESSSPLTEYNITHHQQRKRIGVSSTTYVGDESNGMHYYVVTAWSSTGESVCSNCQSVNVNAASPPIAPYLYSIIPNPIHVSMIYLSWKAVGNVAHYLVYESTSAINASTIGGLSPIATVKFPRTGCFVNNVATNGTYFFAIVAWNGAGNSAPSNCQQLLVILDLPAAPVLASISPDPNPVGNITLHWNDVRGAFYYVVYVSSSPMTETDITSLLYDNAFAVFGNCYTDAEANGIYYYVVTAWNNAGESNCSNCQSVTVSAVAPATAPLLQAILPDPSGTEGILLNWTAVSDACGYLIYVSNVPITSSNIGSVTPIMFVQAPQTTYVDSQATNGTLYYAITAWNGGGESVPSNCQQITRALPLIPPSTYIGVWAGESFMYTATVSCRIYRLYSVLSNGTYVFMLTVDSVISNGRTTTIAYHGVYSNASESSIYTYRASETINCTDTSVTSIFTPSYTFIFFINKNISNKTCNPGLQNDYGAFMRVNGTWDNSGIAASMLYWTNDTVGITSVQFARVLTPSAPLAVSAAADYGRIILTWTAPASNGMSAITGYRIYRGTTSGGETLLTTVGDVTTYTVTGLMNGQVYYFKISAVNANGTGANSTEVIAIPLIPSSMYVGVVPGNSFQYIITNFCTLYSFFYGMGNGTYNFVLTVDNVTGNGRNTTIGYHGVFSNVTNSLIYTLYGSETINGTDTAVMSIFTPTYSFLFFINKNIANKTCNSGLQNFYGAVRLLNATWDGSGVMTSMLFWQNGWGNMLSLQYSRVTTPNAPQAISATARNGHVVLAWTMPASNGHSPITGYRIYCGTAPGIETFLINLGNMTTCNITGLTNSQKYYFIVQAVNAMGNGVNSTETSLIYRSPVARFNVVSNMKYINTPVSFTDTSEGVDSTIVSWSWSFGDGTNGTGRNVTHAYAEPGVYIITLIVRDGNGLESNATVTITVFAITSRQGLMGITAGFIIVLSAGVVIVMTWRKKSLKRDWIGP